LLGVLPGVGGVILVPALTEASGAPVDIASGTTLFALLLSAPVAAYAAIRRVSLAPAQSAPLCVAAARQGDLRRRDTGQAKAMFRASSGRLRLAAELSGTTR
jgi:hypothetical protein